MSGPTGSFNDTDLPGQQGRIAFSALAVERRPIARDELADILWDEAPPSQWSGALAAIVSKIRSLITGTGLDGQVVMASVGGTYTLVLPSGSWVDWEIAIRRLDRAEGAARHGDFAGALEEATVASGILRRPMLVGVDCNWAARVRRRQTDALYRCLVTLAAAWIELGDQQLASTVAESAVQVDPLRELGHRLLVEAEAARGDRAAALGAWSRCEQLMADELGVEPSSETVELGNRIRHGRTGSR
ncbi:MAG: bacterial transcriptional activator domain-containing protein [Acidimicrobiia bacterium]|nr:bacterial transcriptional activator domain-containing protein [Acidimicrobiia bacterium]